MASSEFVRARHPDLPGREVDVPVRAWPAHQRSGWVEAKPAKQSPAKKVDANTSPDRGDTPDTPPQED